MGGPFRCGCLASEIRAYCFLLRLSGFWVHLRVRIRGTLGDIDPLDKGPFSESHK